MKFIISSVRFLIRMTLVGMIMRAVVALYLGLWDFALPATFDNTLGPFLYGWHFDLAIGSFIYLILFGGSVVFGLSEKNHNRISFVLLLIYTMFIGTDAIYAKESGRHISYEVYNLLSIQGSLASLLKQYWLQAVIALLAASFFNRFLPRYQPLKGFLKRTAAVFFVLIIGVVCARGFEGIPQDPSWAYRSGGGSKGATLALNGAYGILWATLSGKKSSKENIVVPGDIKTAEIFNEWKEHRGIKKPFANFDGNIVIVFLEGWPGVYVDKKVGEDLVLPFFSNLRKDSLHVDLMLAGGHRTTEGLFATLCSLPNPPGKSIMFSEIENKDFQCFPQFLAKKGYNSAFFQGSDQFTSGVGLLVLKTGFQESHGKREIPHWESLDANAWGVFDQDLYKFALSLMDQMQEPMLIGLNTNTTHDRELPQGVRPAFGDENAATMHLSVTHHADKELRDFYEALKKRPWKKDWVLVLLSDHTSFSANGIFEHYSIPFLMKYHSVTDNKKPAPFAHSYVPGVFSQKDVGATLADLTGNEAPTFLGRSLLHPQDFSDGASIFHLGQTVWYEGDWAVIFNIREYGQKKCFRWATDMNFQLPLPCPPEAENIYLRGLSFIKESQELLFR
ncbi:LTA synthase family protein [Bdellovibrio reynosensis]|uniref:LTA synthase family protein n=1 Tax=Bdellovibrio reynosensis TaxID=2835041 RepID=A0ABY4CAJ4_9BACT|nr:LTA synthase family protein [Bdellovibrio reynosensis]UOF01878.1 LTA synthase family protein [Bdellovibrio reynosensis]